MIVKRHIGLPENEMGIIESEDMLIHNIVTSELKEKDQIITQLTNNWNELEECVKNKMLYAFKNEIGYYKEVLDKMKEIKEGKNE